MSYDYMACKRSLECLFSSGALGKIKSWYRFASSKAQEPPFGESSKAQEPPFGEETGRQNYLRHWYPPICGAAIKRDTRFRGMCTRSAMVNHQSATH
ncbi:hypothetical protein TNCV_1603201 [Trichonephila clavipes]|nr:hypothetical protein TNCV_1603201 [Trichonephila clavipes]